MFQIRSWGNLVHHILLKQLDCLIRAPWNSCCCCQETYLKRIYILLLLLSLSSLSCCTNNKSQRLTTEKREGKTELHSTKECAPVRFAMWPKTFIFLANSDCRVCLRKNSLPALVVAVQNSPLLGQLIYCRQHRSERIFCGDNRS